MKKTIFAVLFVFMAIFAVNAYGSELKPKVWKIKRSENLTRISERYSLSVKDILAANSGSRCIKNPNLILAGCKIFIPITEIPEVKAWTYLNEYAYQDVLSRARKAETRNSQKNVLIIALIGGSIMLTVFIATLMQAGLSKNTEIKKLRTNLEVARQQVNALNRDENEKKTLMDQIGNDGAIIHELQDFLTESAACAEGAFYPFESRDNGRICDAYKVRKSHVRSDGKPVVDLLECTSEGCGAQVLPGNCNSHYWKQHHGTSEDNRPDGFKE